MDQPQSISINYSLAFLVRVLNMYHFGTIILSFLNFYSAWIKRNPFDSVEIFLPKSQLKLYACTCQVCQNIKSPTLYLTWTIFPSSTVTESWQLWSLIIEWNMKGEAPLTGFIFMPFYGTFEFLCDHNIVTWVNKAKLWLWWPSKPRRWITNWDPKNLCVALNRVIHSTVHCTLYRLYGINKLMS